LDAEGLKHLFAPFGAVSVKRMFGGAGVYAEGLCFAIEADGEVYLKADGENRGAFAAAGSKPFVYQARGKAMEMSYWRLVASAYDDEDELRRWAGLALAAARRAAAAKAKPKAAGRARR
jgi:DNA transformation protein